ncbi:hypothetical protein B0H14DRAFT_3525563 [Mycena olivaceomarginata]|nr:hypothetical protein B0H14DRAFT_3525563 [Mycena olivaceomarginata]
MLCAACWSLDDHSPASFDAETSSFLSNIPDLPEPPSPGSSSSTSTSGLPSPPATNSTGSGSTGDPASIAVRGGRLNMLNGTNIKTFHAAFSSASAAAAADDEQDDYDNDNDDGDGEDNTARLDQQRRHSASENVLALQRVKSLTQRNKMALDKLSSFSRLGSPSPSGGAGSGGSSARRASVTRSPHPPPPASSSSTSDSRSNSNSTSSHSNSNSASSDFRSNSNSTSTSSHSHLASTSTGARPSMRRARTQDHQSGSETERDDDHADHLSAHRSPHRPTTPLPPPGHTRQRLVSAPASPQKHLTLSSSRAQGQALSHSSGSASGSSTKSPRRSRVSNLSFSSRAVVDLGDDGGYDDNYGTGGGEASSPEDVTRAALAAVASARRSPSSGLGTARRMNMSPTATGGSGKKRQPLPREWGAGSVGGSSSGNGRFSAEPPTSPPQHQTSPNKRHSLAGSTASSTSASSLAGHSRGHAHSNSTSSTSTIGGPGRASTVRDLARRHQARFLSEDFGNGGERDRERRQSLRAGSAESALGAGRSLIGEGLRAAGLAGRERGAGGDVFSPQDQEQLQRTPARVEWADGTRSRSVSRQSGHGLGHGRAATSMADYASYDRRVGDGDEPLRTAPPLRTYRSSAHVLDAATGAARGQRDGEVSVTGRGERERYAPSPSPFGSVRRHGSGGGGSGGSGQQEHTKLMGDSLAMFEGHLARVAGAGERTSHDLATHAQKLVGAAERLNAILRAGTARALEEQIDAEVSGVDGGSAPELAEVWRRVGGEYREGLRVSDELVRGVTGFLLGVGRVVRDFGEGRGSDEGRGSASPDAGRDGRRSVESRRSMEKDDRRTSGGTAERTSQSYPSSRRLLTPREQRELHASGGIVASDSQETVLPDKHGGYEPSPTPASRKQNQTTLDRSRTLPPISIPKPLPTLPSESSSTLRRNQTTGATGFSSQRRRTLTSGTQRGDARMAFPTLPRSDSDKSIPARTRNNTVTFSRPSTVALAGLQMQHERERQRTISNTNNQLDAAAVAVAAAAGPSGSETEKDTRKRSSVATHDRPRMSLEGGVESTGQGHAADRSAAAGLSSLNQTLGQKRERRRTVTDIWPPPGS